MSAPTIETARLRLRPHVAEDFEPFAALFATDRARHMGGPLSRRDAWFRFGADVGQWEILGFGAWAVERQEDGALVGQVGLNRPPHFPERELGWLLFEGHEGHGFAAEAATAARAFAFRDLGFETLVSYIDPDNGRSLALAERLGARPDPDAARPDAGDVVYRHPRPEHV
ncbi:GNAT family N-acetyltransferase [Tranquillimonas alkanivorans]|uniref:Protein N-acetyltransferase, RimJ/RimL family n=1 Tax=Tranquillimonas alkanivorans TaxID=441119 RepID=A0A1I5TFS6_9RHOB|nr:GNAT family N-acetyltransferase [Tranquillimonas alkanivorans]SFP81883.1 Protein N-acetyltransferase, RimJ/RimL family [Tranquillimonas alkanivorans]